MRAGTSRRREWKRRQLCRRLGSSKAGPTVARPDWGFVWSLFSSSINRRFAFYSHADCFVAFIPNLSEVFSLLLFPFRSASSFIYSVKDGLAVSWGSKAFFSDVLVSSRVIRSLSPLPHPLADQRADCYRSRPLSFIRKKKRKWKKPKREVVTRKRDHPSLPFIRDSNPSRTRQANGFSICLRKVLLSVLFFLSLQTTEKKNNNNKGGVWSIWCRAGK